LEISDLYEQWGGFVYEDNSSPLPANNKITWLIKEYKYYDISISKNDKNQKQ